MFEIIFTSILFLLVFLLFSFEVLDKVAVVLGAWILLMLVGIVDEHEVIGWVDFETIFLLTGMMLLVDGAKQSGVFSWLNLKITKLTAGNPLVILLLFLSVTAVFSAFLDNVTTIIIILPLTIELTRGLGLNPRLYVIFVIMFSNIGGTLTLVGDPPNILIGSAKGFSFMDFITNLWIPVLIISVSLMLIVVIKYWKTFKPINDNLPKLMVSNLLIQKAEFDFGLKHFNKNFAIQSGLVVLFTVLNFLFPHFLNLSPGFIALLGASILFFMCCRHMDIHKVVQEIEWGEIVFFFGLFIIVGALGKVGMLDIVSESIVAYADTYHQLVIEVLWVSGIVSAFVNNIPFIAVMIPVLDSVLESGKYALDNDPDLVWWALSLGACLGGNGTLVGASANLIGIGIARKYGVKITFGEFFKYGFIITIGSLVVSTGYLLVRMG